MDWLAIVGIGALVALNLGYLVTSGLRGRGQASSDAAAAWKDEAEALQARVERLESELRIERESKATLSGRVEELSTQNAMLAGLVVGETVPKPLADALTGSSNRVVKRVDDAEDRIASGILAMTQAVTKVVGELRDALVALQHDPSPRER